MYVRTFHAYDRPVPDPYRRLRLSLFALTLLTGIGISSWVTRTPAVRDAVDASTAQMGLILFGLSVGSMVGVLSAGAVVRRRGARPVIVLGSVLVVVGVAVIALGAGASTAAGVFAGLLLVGLGGGLGEIGLNIEAAAVEAITGRPVLPALHGCFSLGTVVGALAGIGLTAARFPVLWHLLAAVVVMIALAAWAFPGIPAGTGRVAGRPGASAIITTTAPVRAVPACGATRGCCSSASSCWRWPSPRARPRTGSRCSWSTVTGCRPRAGPWSSPASRSR